MTRLIALLIAAVAVAVPVVACDAPVTQAVVQEVLRVSRGGKVVFGKQTRGVMKPLVSKVTTELRSTVIAEEILADFESRNAESVELSVANAADLKDYMAGDGIDWTRLERDFSGVGTVVELSRPGCDSQSAFAIVQARYHNWKDRSHPEGVLFHVAKQPDATWKVERSVMTDAKYLAQ